jgi:hypothetical protein
VSSNWAGYAAHRSGVHFRSVSAAWRQPRVSCTAPRQAYSAMWVGIGGYSQSAGALEQIGTEVDCSRSGRNVSSAWYELVPSPSVPIRMTVRPGDVMLATVSLGSGRRVTLTLTDATRHKTFRRTIRASAIDDTAAEWILEAPSACTSETSCQALPLANFGTAEFGLATAKTTGGGGAQPISSGTWDTTQISLAPHGRRFVSYDGTVAGGGAVASALSGNGSSFTLSYTDASTPAQTPPSYGPRRAG